MRESMSYRLRRVRRELDLSPREMDRLLGLDRGLWEYCERGLHLPGSRILAALVNVGVNANWLLTGRGALPVSAENMR